MSHTKTNPSIDVVKASGKRVSFDREKLRQSLLRSGASALLSDEIVSELSEMIYSGISTRKIYKEAFRLLRQASGSLAARYKLKQAIMELGPTGYPFERFVGALLKEQGFGVQIGVFIEGLCVTHEIDVLAEKGDLVYLVECKFHSQQGFISDVKIPLYIDSRFRDIENRRLAADASTTTVKRKGWIITNTRFSDDALQYGHCVGIALMGWDYPAGAGIKEQIDSLGLHPITCLTTLTKQEKTAILNQNIVLCRSLVEDSRPLEKAGVQKGRFRRVIEECRQLSHSATDK